MADIDILSFPVAPGLGGNEDVPIVQGGVSKRTTVQAIANLAIVPSAVTWKQQCAAATVEALPSNSYDNGFGGVGATLTATANGALEVDGYSPILDDRILVKNEATTANNGIYFVSQVGTGSLPWILTRAIDFDNIDNIQAGDACQITGGSTLASTFWIEVTVPTSIGSSPIVFAQLFLQYTAGNGIEINGASIAIDPAVVATLTGSQTLLNKTLSAPVITGLSANAILGTDGSGTVEAATTTGTGAVVLADSPTLVTPYLGVPSFIDLTNAVNLPPGSLPDGAIGLPIVGNGTGTPATFQQVPISAGVGGLGTGVSAFLATPSSANLATAVTDETGSGPLVFATSPTLVSPALGTPTSIVLTNGTGLPISSGVSGLGTGVATFLATPSSANLAAALTDETGTGSAVFANSPALTGTPTAPTASVGTNTTQIATTAFVLANGGGVNVADRTALAALSTSKAVAWLEEAGRQGTFQWNSANLSTQVTADTQQGIYIAPSSDPTGVSGAWVRVVQQRAYDPRWFGAKGDGTTNDTAALQAALNMASAYGGNAVFVDGNMNYLFTQITLPDRLELFGNTFTLGAGSPIYSVLTSAITSSRAITLGLNNYIHNLVIINSTGTYNTTTLTFGGNTASAVYSPTSSVVEEYVFYYGWQIARELGNGAFYVRSRCCENNRCEYGWRITGGPTYDLDVVQPTSEYTNVYIDCASGDDARNIKITGGSIENFTCIASNFLEITFTGTYFETQASPGVFAALIPTTTDSPSMVTLTGCTIYLNGITRFLNASGLSCGISSTGNKWKGQPPSGAIIFYLPAATSTVHLAGDTMGIDSGYEANVIYAGPGAGITNALKFDVAFPYMTSAYAQGALSQVKTMAGLGYFTGIQTSAPVSPITDVVYTADGSGWDPLSKSGGPYQVIRRASSYAGISG